MSDEPREKKSWKELDQMRDRGIKPTKTMSKQAEFAQKRASSAAKKELESLFSGSALNKGKAAKIEEIQSHRGKPTYYQKMTDYIAEFGVPLDWDTQMFFLDHRDAKTVIQILDEMKKRAPTQPLQKQDVLAKKLDVMALSTFDPDLHAKIKELQSALMRN